MTVPHDNKPPLVIVPALEYVRLKGQGKQVLLTEEMPEWLAKRIMASEMDARFAHLNDGIRVPPNC